MAIITETADSGINAYATGSFNITAGDTFTGAITSGDTQDGINLTGLTPGQSYTISVTIADLAGYTGLNLINSANFHSIGYHVTNGTPHYDIAEMTTGWVRDFVTTSPIRLVGNTISFDFVPGAGKTSFAFQIQSDQPESYSITLGETVEVPAITEGADTLTGTSGDDNLAMLGGDDVVDGGAGLDTIAGNGGNDTMTGGDGEDLFVIGTGDGADVITDFVARTDRIDLTALGFTAIEDLTLTDSEAGLVITLGADQSVTLTGQTVETISGSDFVFATNVMTGTAAEEHLTGKSGVDHITGGAGRDKLDGNDGDDSLAGDAGNDLLLGGAGADTLDGGTQNDRLHGGDDNDLLLGGDGGDQLYGDAGDDRLDGGLGKDHLYGGAGADVFVFGLGSNRDVIYDFTNGEDQIDLTALNLVDFAALDIRSMGTDAQIVLAATNIVTLLGVDAATLDASDFIL